MALQDTNLILQIGKISPTFRGTPQQFLDEILRRAKIVSPSGTNFIFVGDTEPTSNVGPWLRDGVQWWVFDEETKRYIPLDISQSETTWYHIGNTVPATSTPPVWLKTTLTPTAASPSVGQPISWYVFNGTAWVSYVGIVFSGTTAQRPASPVALQQYYDTDIACLIWYERDAWRTVAGTPGDIKATIISTLTEALRFNPGWEVLGASNSQLRGRIVMQAAKDPGATPETVLTTPPSVATRASGETFGETDAVTIDPVGVVPYPPQVAYWHLVKL